MTRHWFSRPGCLAIVSQECLLVQGAGHFIALGILQIAVFVFTRVCCAPVYWTQTHKSARRIPGQNTNVLHQQPASQMCACLGKALPQNA